MRHTVYCMMQYDVWSESNYSSSFCNDMCFIHSRYAPDIDRGNKRKTWNMHEICHVYRYGKLYVSGHYKWYQCIIDYTSRKPSGSWQPMLKPSVKRTDKLNSDSMDDGSLDNMYKGWVLFFMKKIKVSETTNIDFRNVFAFVLDICTSFEF